MMWLSSRNGGAAPVSVSRGFSFGDVPAVLSVSKQALLVNVEPAAEDEMLTPIWIASAGQALQANKVDSVYSADVDEIAAIDTRQ